MHICMCIYFELSLVQIKAGVREYFERSSFGPPFEKDACLMLNKRERERG